MKDFQMHQEGTKFGYQSRGGKYLQVLKRAIVLVKYRKEKVAVVRCVSALKLVPVHPAKRLETSVRSLKLRKTAAFLFHSVRRRVSVTFAGRGRVLSQQSVN